MVILVHEFHVRMVQGFILVSEVENLRPSHMVAL